MIQEMVQDTSNIKERCYEALEKAKKLQPE